MYFDQYFQAFLFPTEAKSEINFVFIRLMLSFIEEVLELSMLD